MNKNINERRSMLLSEKMTQLENENERLRAENKVLSKTISTYEKEFANIARLIGDYEKMISEVRELKENYRGLVQEASKSMNGYKKEAQWLINRMKNSI